MKTQTLFIVLLLGMFSSSFSQTPPDTLWTKTFGGQNDEECRCVIQTRDGGFALAGYTKSFGAGEEDMYLVRTDTSGDTLWTRTYGSSSSDGCNSIIQTDDDGFLLAGWTRGPENIGYLVKTDLLGDTLWTRSFSEMFFFEWDSRPRGGIFSLLTTSDNGISLVGIHFDSSDSLASCYLIKTNDIGDTLWTRKYSYNDTLGTAAINHIQTADNGYALPCVIWYGDLTSGETITQEAWLIKTDSNGDTMWTKTFDEGNFFDLFSIVKDPDGSFSLAGGTDIGNDICYFLHIGLDTFGNELWTYYYGYGNAWCRTHIRTNDAGYLLVGEKWGASTPTRRKDIYVIKTNLTGDTLWTTSFGGDFTELCYSVIQTDDWGFVLAGYTESFGAGGRDFWMIKTGDSTGIEYTPNRIPKEFTLNQNYPNPFNPETEISFDLPEQAKVTLTVYNILGHVVDVLIDTELRAGSHKTRWNGDDAASGVYFYRLKAGDFVATKKMLLLK